jgi:SAM-dependent methyltransferase
MFDCFRKAAPKKLINIGCGRTYHPDWENYDLAPVHPEIKKINLERSLPLPGKSYEAVYCSHVLEHLSRSRVPQVLKEFARILQPGGICRIVVPDLAEIARAYLQSYEEAQKKLPGGRLRHEWMTLELLDQLVRATPGGCMGRWWKLDPVPGKEFIQTRVGQEATAHWKDRDPKETPVPSTDSIYMSEPFDEKRRLAFLKTGENHRWMYDEVSLGYLLSKEGFVDVKLCRADESGIQDFRHYHLDTDESGQARKPDSLFMEARAP